MEDPNITLLQKAQDIAKRIIESDAGVRAVVLYGSVAVQQAGEGSDVDLLVLSDNPVSGRKLARKVPDLREPVFNTAYYTPLLLDKARQRDWTFPACLSEQAVLLAGDEECLHWLYTPVPPRDVSAAQVNRLREQLQLADALMSISSQRQAFEIYRSVRQALVLLCASHGLHTWRRNEAFEATKQLLPQVSHDIDIVADLYPHWEALHRHTQTPPPSKEETRTAILSATRIYDAVQAML
jgi:predicted nucleotidyltransferase